MRKFAFSYFLFFFTLSFASHPFSYDLHLTKRPGKDSGAVITAHGMGGNYQIVEWVPIDKTRFSFNFPDHDLNSRHLKAADTKFGTIDEVLPFLYTIKKAVIDEKHQARKKYHQEEELVDPGKGA